MRRCKFLLVLFIGTIVLSCSKEGDQHPDPPLGKIEGKLVYEEVDSYDYDIGNYKYHLKVLDASGTYTIPSIPMLNRLNPVWSSEGDAIWYLYATNYVPFSGYNDVAVNRILHDGSQDTSLLQSNWLEGGEYDALALSPDGKYLALNKSSQLEIYEVVDKLQLKFLKALEGGGEYYNFWWSPDSKKIVYSKRSWPNDWDLLVYDLESKVIKNLLPGTLSGSQVSWAYTSDRIAFSGDDDIFIVDADGTNLVNVTNTPGIEEQSPAFSPVVDKLIYANVDSSNQVILFDLTSGTKEVIIAGRDDVSYFNNYDYNTFTWSKDGSAFLFRYTTASQSGLRRFKFDGHQIEAIYVGSIKRFDWYETL